ncbi:purine-cytosine permease family protein [Amycolatopsis jiangsuensis]|uniref:NCS1 family nucleobase:cation symporter-1 n=1 Tax=Amycolatopsis jiangsuensis TaxID=1181879 RepID=A0A840J1X4_9PSEU|nr:cytosine permease [Amycolatopsis jiangsuensis]MBB4689071.1 NCS1 family nucleobase:cation symporter-1 [Amycolatopsis jiangsuensis]
MAEQDGALTVERRSIDFVPEAERHGRARGLFAVWFAANMQVTTMVTGALGVLLGLSLPWAVLALVLGNLAGALLMALHSAQGPKLGVPQMIQSRAQFGFHGAILPLLLVIVMYIGFFATSAVLGGQALAGATGMNTDLAIVVVAAVCTVLAVFGYRLIHRVDRWISLISALGFVYLTVRLLQTGHVAQAWHGGGAAPGTFLLVVSVAATWQITFAPYVADYSRYLPKATSVSAAFWWTYAGAVLGTIWMMLFGAVAVAVAGQAFDGGSIQFVVDLAPGAHGLFAVIVILGIIAINVLNLYGCFMSTATTLTAVRRHGIGPRGRIAYLVTAAVVSTAIAIAGRGNFLANYENFILFLAYFLIPWTAINLVDFYAVRKERYDVSALFDPDGQYGRVNWRALLPYLAAIIVEVPFMSTTFYTGPMVAHVGGADISWILGTVVAGGLYYVAMRYSPEFRGLSTREEDTV